MNTYNPEGPGRIQERDMAAVPRTYALTPAASFVALEWQRGCQAEAEVDWLLKQNGVTAQAGASFVSRLRQTIGAALVRAGDRLAGIPHSGVSPELASAAAGTHGGTPTW
jgi:hypothetical protein